MATVSYTFFKKNSQRVDIVLKDADGNFMNTATVTATLFDKATPTPNAIAGFTNIVFTLQAGSIGLYRGVIDNTFDPPTGSYKLILDTVQGPNANHWEFPAHVVVRNT